VERDHRAGDCQEITDNRSYLPMVRTSGQRSASGSMRLSTEMPMK
jgi:hypothetical protein